MECESCKTYIHESYPHKIVNNIPYCMDCSFVNGYIDEETYLFSYPVQLSNLHVEVINGSIYVYQGELRNAKTNRRKTAEYKIWRNSVYARDNYTCQKCGKVGGKLNAHHIIPLAVNIELVYEIDNGITLCNQCHNLEHKIKKGRCVINGDLK